MRGNRKKKGMAEFHTVKRIDNSRLVRNIEPAKMRSLVRGVALGGVVGSADTAPTQQSYEVFEVLSKAIDEQLAKWKSLAATDVKSYNDVVKQQDVPALMLKPSSEGH